MMGNGKNKEKQIMSSKACKKAKRNREFAGVKSEIKGAFVIQRERSLEKLKDVAVDVIPKDYLRIHHGTVAVQDKKTKDIVLVVKCIPFNEMLATEYQEYQELMTTLISIKCGVSLVKCNRAQLSGEMYALGWRAGRDKGLFIGRYVPSRQFQRDAVSLEKWELQQDLIPKITSLYGKNFRVLAPSLFDCTKAEVAHTGVPSLSEKEFDIIREEEGGFCSNLTFTIKDFNSAFHDDRDHNPYTFGIWAPISSNSGVLSKKKDGFRSEGGEFLIGSYKMYVDFNACDGVVQIIWQGKVDFHSTMPSITPLEYTRIGTSVQVNQDLVQRMKLLLKMQADGFDISHKIRGVQKIMDLKLQNVK